MTENNKVSIVKGNSKLGKVLCVSLPPIATCRKGAPCYKNCYARLHAYCRRANVKEAWDNNYRIWLKTPDEYFWQIHQAIRKHPSFKVCRWHVGGDLPNVDYFGGVVTVARANPAVSFLLFTKQYEVLQEYGKMHIPANLRVVLSGWPGLPIPADLRKRFATAWMKDPKDPDKRIPKNAQECGGGCDKCLKCWGLKAGESVFFNRH